MPKKDDIFPNERQNFETSKGKTTKNKGQNYDIQRIKLHPNVP